MSSTLLSLLILAGPVGSDIKRDEVVIFFDTWAWREPENRHWVIPIHGWIFEPEHDSFARATLLNAISDVIDVDNQEANEAEALLRERARCFIVDNERDKKISVRLGNKVYSLPPSREDGHFSGVLNVPDRVLRRPATQPSEEAAWVCFKAILPQEDDRSFSGTTLLMKPSGLSVISDIDDTIRISHVRDPKTVLKNTFLRPFEAVEGMAAVYERWAKAGATFHWISESPWQLYLPLKKFMAQQGFPKGTFALKSFRLKGSSLLNLFDDPAKTKPMKIEPLLKTFPQRRFIFVGDSGQKDPEIYGDLARHYDDQVIGIFIRNVTDEPGDAGRYRQAFREVPGKKWMIFSEAKEIDEAARRLARLFGSYGGSPVTFPAETTGTHRSAGHGYLPQ